MTFVEWFGWLTFWHFAVDWLAQSEWEAREKTRSKFVLMMHALIYGACMMVVMGETCAVLGTYENELHFGRWWPLPVALAWLPISHGLVDTYVPLTWWVKYVRRAEVLRGVALRDCRAIMSNAAQDPGARILFTTVDQIMHVMTLMPVAWVMSSLG